MRFFWLFCALGALLGCRSVSEPSGTAIALFCSTDQGAKTESLTVGEEVAVFAGPEGTEDYFLEAAQFIVGSDGRSLTYGSTVYYPDPKQAVRFFAYFPYHKGTFSVPTDQSTATALKEADLCGAVARTTPVATPVALEFRHLMARVVITTKEPTTKISFPNAVASGVLHAATAELVLADTRSDIWTESTTSKELIVPVQPLSRLVLTVSGVEYVFDSSVSLEAGKTTTLDLTLHPNTKTATLSGSSVTDWELVKTEGNPTHAVSNLLTLHWSNHLPQGTTPDQVVFTIGGMDYTVSSGIAYANQTFTVPFASETLRYPYTISKIDFYQAGRLVQSCADLLGGAIVKSGVCVVGIRQWPTVVNPPAESDYVEINDLYWAKGNLVAINQGNAKVGAPADGGLYFQFGSLIGYKGGNQDNGGTGVGMPKAPLTTNGTYWNGSFSWANDAMVWPAGLMGTPTRWPQLTSGTAHQWFFSGQGVTSETINVTDAAKGVGDPCTYYLGGSWRLPTNTDYAALFGNVAEGAAWGSVMGWDWRATPPGAVGPSSLFFPASGLRYSPNGSFHHVTTNGYYWSSSVYSATYGYYLRFNSGNVYPQNSTPRSGGFPVRCVSPVS